MLGTAPAMAQPAWNLGSAAQPGSPLILFGEHFISTVNKTSGGAIAMEHQFVASEQEDINQVIRGRLQSSQLSYAGSAASSSATASMRCKSCSAPTSSASAAWD